MAMILLDGCTKEKAADVIRYYSQTGFKHEIESYKAGNYWVYEWSNGAGEPQGTDTVMVTSVDLNAEKVNVISTVYGVHFNITYSVTDSLVTYNDGSWFTLQEPNYIVFSASDSTIDFPLKGNSRGGGCKSVLKWEYNQPVEVDGAFYPSIAYTDKTEVSGNECACGFQTINYVKGLGEVYRETCEYCQDNSCPPNLKRKLKAYYIQP